MPASTELLKTELPENESNSGVSEESFGAQPQAGNPLALEIQHLSKRYRIGSSSSARYTTLRETLMGLAASPFRRLRELSQWGQFNKDAEGDEVLWALRDVSFSVSRGEVVGVIGSNGAGKSTLLKVLSRITEPTEGQALVNGRVGSLLEVGTGFHKELTGRENIFLNGAILGMSRREIQDKFDDIVEFAGVERFLDTPVKRYSSGMYVRLAFAVAANLDPEILIVDEVLAVGDAGFQKRCLGKMHDLAASGQRTVLFVSHNMVAVQSLCDRVVWLEHGTVREIGAPADVVPRYLSQDGIAATKRKWKDPASRPGNECVRLCSVAVEHDGDDAQDRIPKTDSFRIAIEYEKLIAESHFDTTLQFCTLDGIIAFSSGTGYLPNDEPAPIGSRYRTVCTIPGNLLNCVRYRVILLVVKDGTTIVYSDDSILHVEIVDNEIRECGWFGKIPGAVYPKLDWSKQQLADESADPKV